VVVEQLGNTSFVHGSIPSGARLSIALNGQTDITPGCTVFIKPIAGSVHVFRTTGIEEAVMSSS
jgi:hypothetical protein